MRLTSVRTERTPRSPSDAFQEAHLERTFVTGI
ncbi:hypothetical protein GA0115252_13954 [Streptomyces sp. DfronAA-171]|nr:hypothetical protein GA0115252_13954 [Streptomyces sp. DfronAA-171]